MQTKFPNMPPYQFTLISKKFSNLVNKADGKSHARGNERKIFFFLSRPNGGYSRTLQSTKYTECPNKNTVSDDSIGLARGGKI
jgi:hypothetical protein